MVFLLLVTENMITQLDSMIIHFTIAVLMWHCTQQGLVGVIVHNAQVQQRWQDEIQDRNREASQQRYYLCNKVKFL